MPRRWRPGDHRRDGAAGTGFLALARGVGRLGPGECGGAGDVRGAQFAVDATVLEWAGVAEVVTGADRAVTPKTGARLHSTERHRTLTAAESAPGTRHQRHEDVAGIGQASRRQQPARERSPNATTDAHARAAGRRPGESGPGPHRPGPGPLRGRER